MNKNYEFLVNMPETAKQAFSRETYKRLVTANDEYFTRGISNDAGLSLHLAAGETTVDDRFVFMYLAAKMHDELDEKSYNDLAPFIYMMREVSMPFELDPKAESGVVIRPDYSRWAMNDEGSDGKKMFRETWNIIPGKYREWIKRCFSSIQKDLECLIAEQSSNDDIIIAA